MLASTSKQPSMAKPLRSIILCSSRQLHTSAPLRIAAQPSESSSSPPAARAHQFFTSDGPLLRALRRRQESYRLRSLPSPKNPRKADRLEAISLAKSEIRWASQHVRSSQASPSSSSQLDRSSRRALIQMCTRMTRDNVPLSYLLGSVPFGSLPEELTVRPPVLLPRPETESWATQVVSQLVELLETQGRREIRVVDLCTGSGCIALLLAHALRSKLRDEGGWKVFACDKSPLAVELAIENANKLGFNLNSPESNLHILQADIFDDADMDHLADLAGAPFDLILSNPPYIPRREWNSLSPEVKEHEDPAALIGERSVSPSTSANPIDVSARQSTDLSDRESYLDRAGLSFHSRLATLLYRPWFSSSSPPLPRLVAEYGKGQQKAVEKLHYELKAPKDRLPKVVNIEGHPLVVVGVGNATTHPNTRHSIGQVVLQPLLQGLIELDGAVRRRLREIKGELEESRTEALQTGRINAEERKDWSGPVPNTIPIQSSHDHLDLSQEPNMPTTLTRAQSGGWSTILHLLVPSSASFFTQSLPSDATLYSIEIHLYKPSQPMNLSGVGLKTYLNHHHPLYPSPPPFSSSSAVVGEGKKEGWRIEDDVLVLQDELDLNFGEVKRRDRGSARGHNGVRDIITRLSIPDSTPTISLQGKGRSKKGGEEGGPKLSRIRIGIGRPDTPSQSPFSNSGSNSWLPPSLTKSKKVKPVPIDRWVLSPLQPNELQSCEVGGEVLNQVQKLVLEWISDRCSTLSSRNYQQVEEKQNQARIESKKDQFGVYRTVWVY